MGGLAQNGKGLSAAAADINPQMSVNYPVLPDRRRRRDENTLERRSVAPLAVQTQAT